MRNLVVISTEKLFLLRRGISLSFRQRSCFYFDEESLCHSDREVVFASTRNRVVIPTGKDPSVAKSSFRMTVAFCHSDREVVFASTRNLYVFRQAKILQSRKAPSEWQWLIVIPTLREISLPLYVMVSLLKFRLMICL